MDKNGVEGKDVWCIIKMNHYKIKYCKSFTSQYCLDTDLIKRSDPISRILQLERDFSIGQHSIVWSSPMSVDKCQLSKVTINNLLQTWTALAGKVQLPLKRNVSVSLQIHWYMSGRVMQVWSTPHKCSSQWSKNK